MQGDKNAQQTLLRLLARFGDVLFSSALDRLKAEALESRGPGAKKKWDEFLDRYCYFHVEAIFELGFNRTKAKQMSSEFSNISFNEMEKAYLRGRKQLQSKTPREKKLMRDDYIRPKFEIYLKGLKRPANTR